MGHAGMTAMLLSLSVVLAAIVFGTPGPLLHARYADSAISADIAYRIAPDKLYGSGPAGLSPAIATGTLTYRWHGRRYRFDLANVLPIIEHHIELPDSPRDGCGAAEALTRRGNYLAIEFYFAEKGCMPGVALIELSSATIARRAAIDWNWDHRFDITEPHLNGTAGVVANVETVRLRKAESGFSTPTQRVHYVPWTFRVVQWRNIRGGRELLAYEVQERHLDGTADAASGLSPKTGETIRVATFERTSYPIFGYPISGADVLVQPDAEENRRYAALQPVTPLATERAIRRGEWLTLAEQRAVDGDLAGAVRASERMLEYEDDEALRPSEIDDTAACRAYIPIAAKQHLSRSAIATLFSNGCKATSPQPRHY